MKLRYVAKTTENGYSFVFRNVLEFKYLADKKFLSVQLQGKRLDLHGVTSFEGVGGFEPWGDDYAMIPPDDGGEGSVAVLTEFEFPQENPVPAELAMTTFAPLDRLSDNSDLVSRIESDRVKRNLSFYSVVLSSIRDAKFRGFAN